MDRVGGLGALPALSSPEGRAVGKEGPKGARNGEIGLPRVPGPGGSPRRPKTFGGAGGTAAAGALEALLDEVYSTGQELARNPSPENIVAYKKSVGRFVRQVVDGAVEIVESEGRLRKDMKKPKYALLHIVDEKLERLGAYVLSNQKDKLEILRKVDELHGLLVDLKH